MITRSSRAPDLPGAPSSAVRSVAPRAGSPCHRRRGLRWGASGTGSFHLGQQPGGRRRTSRCRPRCCLGLCRQQVHVVGGVRHAVLGPLQGVLGTSPVPSPSGQRRGFRRSGRDRRTTVRTRCGSPRPRWRAAASWARSCRDRVGAPRAARRDRRGLDRVQELIDRACHRRLPGGLGPCGKPARQALATGLPRTGGAAGGDGHQPTAEQRAPLPRAAAWLNSCRCGGRPCRAGWRPGLLGRVADRRRGDAAVVEEVAVRVCGPTRLLRLFRAGPAGMLATSRVEARWVS